MAKSKVTSHSSDRGRHGERAAFALSGVMWAVLLALSASNASAAGFGEVQVASQLGERLYARVPLVGEGAADMAPECVRLIPDSALQDAPALSNARVAIDRKTTPPAIVVTTPAVVMEPAVRFVLELGCGNRLRREFVLLIDPPDLPSIQTAETSPSVVPPLARTIPADEPRWGSSNSSAPMQSASAPAFDTPLAEPTVTAQPEPVKAAPAPAPAPRKAAARPRPKPAAAPAQVAQKPAVQPQIPSAPPPPVKAQEAPTPVATDRLVLADSDPAAARPTAEQATAAKDAREEAMARQVEALTKEVAKMREEMEKMAARNRELAKEAESSKTGWFAAGGLGIVLAGVAFGMFSRREKKQSWRDNLAAAGADEDDASFSPRDALPQVREVVPEPKAAAVMPASAERVVQPDTVTDLDVTKLRVDESGNTAFNAATEVPTDILASWAAADNSPRPTLKSLDFSLDDIDLAAATPSPAPPVFKPTAKTEPSEAARAALFEQIERVHQASKKG